LEKVFLKGHAIQQYKGVTAGNILYGVMYSTIRKEYTASFTGQ
jgi:hypothetical protein